MALLLKKRANRRRKPVPVGRLRSVAEAVGFLKASFAFAAATS
jgi:hypothetical protein